MRPKGVIVLLVVLALFGAAMYFFSDEFFEHQIENIGASIVGAKVEIDNFELSLLGLSVSLDRLQVANPNDTWENMFETGRMAFDMELGPLARKKVVVNEVAIQDVRLGARRETDGKIEKTVVTEEPGWIDHAAANLKQQVADAPVLNLGILKQKINVDSLVKTFDIQAVGKIENAREQAQATFATWQQNLAQFRPQDDLKRIEQQAATIKPDQISNVEELVSTVDKTKKLMDELNAIKKDIEAKKQAATTDLQQVTAPFSKVDNWLSEDFNAIKAKANIGDFSAQNIGKMLFGEVVLAPAIEWLEYVRMAREYMPVAQQFMASGQVKKPPRFEGQDIPFQLYNNKPKFLLERLVLSAAGNQADTSRALRLSGLVEGITSQPSVYGEPLTFDLKALLPNANAYNLTGVLDHTGEVPEDRFQARASGIKFGRINLPQRPHLPIALDANKGSITANFNVIGKELDFKVEFAASPVSFSFAEQQANSNIISRVTHEVFAGIDHLNLGAGISGIGEDVRLSISSNIDDILADRIRDVVGKSVEQARQEIRKRLEEIIMPKKEQALAFVAENKQKITSELDKLDQMVQDQISVVESKKQELEAEVEKRKEEGLEDVKDKLKDIFKRN